MKAPLRYQFSEYDCGPITVLNALSLLVESEKIPAHVIKAILSQTMDEKGTGGTSRLAMTLLCDWIGKELSSELVCRQYANLSVYLDLFGVNLAKSAVAIVRTYLDGVEHYVLVTKIDRSAVYIFDPYFFEEYRGPLVQLTHEQPNAYNRIVSIDRFNSTSKRDYALGPKTDRQCIFFVRNFK